MADLVREHARQPVFVTGGPPRTPFKGPGVPRWTNPTYALHHARSWGSLLTQGPMVPLKAAARPESRGAAHLHERLAESLAELAASCYPFIAQIWGPMTLGATLAGTERYLTSLRDPSEAAAWTEAGLEASLLAAEVALGARPMALWIAEPMAAIVDPATLESLWPLAMRRLVARARVGGADPVVHVSGSAAHVLGIAARLGVSGISITADTPLSAAVDHLPPHVVVFGNLDSMRLLDRDEVWLAAAARSMSAEMRGRLFVTTPGSAVPRDVMVDRLAAFVDAARG